MSIPFERSLNDSAELTVEHVAVRGARLAYQIRGTEDLPPLVFVHGYSLRATGALYELFLSELSTRYRVHAFDLRGHGASSNQEPWTLAAAADDIAEASAALGLQGSPYVGHSIGGFLGMLSQARHEGAFGSLSLLATAPMTGGQGQTPEAGELFMRSGRDRAVMHAAFVPMYVDPSDRSVSLAVDAACEVSSAIHAAFFPEFAVADITSSLGKLDVPILMVNGALDVVIALERQHATASALPRCKAVTYSSFGHMLPLEAPNVTAREVLTFLDHDVPALSAASG